MTERWAGRWQMYACGSHPSHINYVDRLANREWKGSKGIAFFLYQIGAISGRIL